MFLRNIRKPAQAIRQSALYSTVTNKVRPIELLQEYCNRDGKDQIIEHHVNRLKIEVKHYSSSAFQSMIIFGKPMKLCLPPTAMALDKDTLYNAIITCFDGKEENFIMNLCDIHIKNTMLYLQYWSDRRLKFVLGHELSHIAHGDMGILKGLRNNILQRFHKHDRIKRYTYSEEYAADARSASIDIDHALGGVEHLLKVQAFFQLIYECSKKRGIKLTKEEFEYRRSDTHPLESSRLERLYKILSTKYNLNDTSAIRKAALKNAGENIIPNITICQAT